MRLAMQPQRGSLLAHIEQDGLDDDKPLGSALRRCMLPGSRTGPCGCVSGRPWSLGVIRFLPRFLITVSSPLVSTSMQ